jgi:hypothetical protein
MNVREIAYKEKLELDEIKFLISEYIREKKGVDVAVILRSETVGFIHPLEFQLLWTAYNIAADYFILKYPKENE